MPLRPLHNPGRKPNLVVLVQEGTPSFRYALWKIGNRGKPMPFASTRISSSHSVSDYLADPHRSPVLDSRGFSENAIYCRVGHNLTPSKNSIRVVSWDDSSNVELWSETATMDGLSNQPMWRPDGGKIVFRAKGAGTTLNVIKHMNPDGSGVATLYTGADRVWSPTYNRNGTLIAFREAVSASSSSLKVMNADGTGVVTVKAGVGNNGAGDPAWMNGSDVIGYVWGSIVFTDPFEWRKVNADGTGDTLLHQVVRSSGYGPGDHDPNAIIWSWLPDDSAIVTSFETPTDPAPNHYLADVAAGGGATFYSPIRSIPSGTPDYRPVVEYDVDGMPRIFYSDADLESGLASVSSVRLDNTDRRRDLRNDVEDSAGGNVIYHGFRGDTLNI
jgi:hypothetical protein